jgi:hypothetical protein
MTRRQIPLLTSAQLIRYLNKINITRDIDECWLWTGAKIPKSGGLFYGTFKNHKYGVQHNAHLWGYRYFVGPLDLELELAHTCLQGLCCNWMSHLLQADHSTNQYMTMDPRFGPGKYCKDGHERTTANTYIDPRGWRECLLCRQIVSATRYQLRG